MFTSRDLLGELARYPNKADGLKTKAHEFMIPLSRMVYASAKDSLYQCLLVMSELKVGVVWSGAKRASDGQVGVVMGVSNFRVCGRAALGLCFGAGGAFFFYLRG